MNNMTRDLTIAYIQNALAEVALLHDTELIEPTLKKFYIERRSARPFEFITKPGRLRQLVRAKPCQVYTVTDADGTSLGDQIHEDDLGSQYSGHILERQITANLDAMLADHTDLVALYRADGSGAAPIFRYRPSNGLGERTTTDGELARRKTAQMQAIAQLEETCAAEERRLNGMLKKLRESEEERESNKREIDRLLNQKAEAERNITRARGVQPHEDFQGQSWRLLQETATGIEHADGPELG